MSTIRYYLFEKLLIWTMAFGTRFKRIGRGIYTLEKLYGNSSPGEPPYYILTWTIRLKFLSLTSYLKARFLTTDEAKAWVHDNLSEDAYAEFLAGCEAKAAPKKF